jgi:phospholipid/cholesterol/gamma-HCH transport system permease protein
MNILAKTGDFAIAKWRNVRNTVSVAWGVLCLAVSPKSWPRTVREQVAKQLLFTGVEAIGLTTVIAVLAGISIVVQAQLWLNRFGQSEVLGPLLVAIIIREVAPMLVNFVVIGRSGTAIATELANMRVRHEVDVLDAQGIEPTLYLIMPRVIGMIASVFCLTVIFVTVCFGSGYLFGLLIGVAAGDPVVFLRSVLGAVSPADIVNLFAKTLVPGLVTGTICSMEGLSIGGTVTEVPQAVTRAVVRSIVALLVVSVAISIVTYL